MTLTAKPWLPANAIADGAIQALVVECVERWALRWLPEPRAITASRSKIERPTKISSSAACWGAEGDAFFVAVDEVSLTKAVAQMIGAPAGCKFSKVDLGLFRQLAEQSFHDLLADLASLFGHAALHFRPLTQLHAENATKYVLAFAAGGPALDLYVNNGVATAARRTAAKGARAGAPFGTLQSAIGRQRIRVGATAGGATIGLDDLYALACGDVIILDHASNDDVPLTINDHVASAACRIQRSELGLELCVTQLGSD